MKSEPDPRLKDWRVRGNGPCCSDDDFGNTGAFRIFTGMNRKPLQVIASDGSGSDIGWEHVSVSCPDRCPTWDEMCFVKDVFWGEDEAVIQFHPPKSEYVNNHRYCLHLWKKIDEDFPLPPRQAVGIKALGTLP